MSRAWGEREWVWASRLLSVADQGEDAQNSQTLSQARAGWLLMASCRGQVPSAYRTLSDVHAITLLGSLEGGLCGVGSNGGYRGAWSDGVGWVVDRRHLGSHGVELLLINIRALGTLCLHHV